MNDRRFELTYTTAVPASARGCRLWIPVPTSDGFQDITKVTASSGRIHRDPVEGNSILFHELPPHPDTEVQIVLTCEIARRRRLTPLPPEIPYPIPVSTLPEGRFLDGNARVPVEGRFREEASDIIERDAWPVQRAAAVFAHVIKTYEYDSSGCTPEKGDAIGDLHVACDMKTGTCTDLHGLLVSFLRVLGIPARFAFGFNVPAKDGGRIGGYHCWAEIFLPVVGWFPVDVSEARKREAGPARQFYFGGLDENRVQFSWGRDLRLEPPQATGPLDKLIFPHAESEGEKAVVHPTFSFRSREPRPL